MTSTSTSTFSARISKDEEALLQTYMPQYELCQVEKKYVTLWPVVLAAHSRAFPVLERMWPGQNRTLKDLSDEENELYGLALVAKHNSIKEWFRWRANPRSRSTTSSVSKKDIQRIYQPGRRRVHKAYEIFVKLYPEIFDPVYEEACRIQGVTGKGRLAVYHKVAARLWREATPEVRAAVLKRGESEAEEREGELDRIDQGEDTPESYHHFQAALPGILTAVIDPAVRRAGMIAVCTMIGPVPEAGGQIMATTLQFGDSPDTPLFSQAWLEHDKSFVEALGQFAVKYEFPEELCAKRSLGAVEGDQARAKDATDPSQTSVILPTPTEVATKGKNAAVGPTKSKKHSKVPTTRRADTPNGATAVPAQQLPPVPSPPIQTPIQSSVPPVNSSTPIPMEASSAPGGITLDGLPSGVLPGVAPPKQPVSVQNIPDVLPAFTHLAPGAAPPSSPLPLQPTPGAQSDKTSFPSPNLSNLSCDELSGLLYHDSELDDENLDEKDNPRGPNVTWEALMEGFDPTNLTLNAATDPEVWANLDVLQLMSSNANANNINMNPEVPPEWPSSSNAPASQSNSSNPLLFSSSTPTLGEPSSGVAPSDSTTQAPAPVFPSLFGRPSQVPDSNKASLIGQHKSFFGTPASNARESWFAAPSNSSNFSFASPSSYKPPSASSSLSNSQPVSQPGSSWTPSFFGRPNAVPAASNPSPLGLHRPISAPRSGEPHTQPPPSDNGPEGARPVAEQVSPTPPPATTTTPSATNTPPAPNAPSATTTPAAAPASHQRDTAQPLTPSTTPAPGGPPSSGSSTPAINAAQPPKPPPITARSSLGIPSFAAQPLSQDKPTSPSLQVALGAPTSQPVSILVSPSPRPNAAPGAPSQQVNPAPGAAPPQPTHPSGTTEPQSAPGAVPPEDLGGRPVLSAVGLGANSTRPKPKMRVKEKAVAKAPVPEAPSAGSTAHSSTPPPQLTSNGSTALPELTLTDPTTHSPPPNPQDTEAPGARRSGRPVAKNTWLEKQNLIGTNTVFHSTPSTTSAGPADEIPPWFLAAVDYFKTADLGDEWTSVLDRWANLEQSLGFGRVGKTPLAVQNRPEEWQKWTAKAKHGVRAYDKIPDIEEPAEFGANVLKWWCTLQPAFRVSDSGSLLPIYTDEAAPGDAWASIRRSGPNGFVSFITLMDWWGRSARLAGPFKDDSRAKWTTLVLDVRLCLNEMLKPVAKRPIDAEPQPSAKRQKLAN